MRRWCINLTLLQSIRNSKISSKNVINTIELGYTFRYLETVIEVNWVG